MIDSKTSLAFTVYSGKGVHALLLGSGISRSSGIPTGWDIVLDLIRKVAVVEDKDCGADPAAWYEATYLKEPDYSDLLEMLAKTSAERMRLLRAYFEPTEDERKAGKKVPTKAHHAIASLVAGGYIRVIVTTNFDRLMEQALQAHGVVPTVIASTDAILGAEPLAHSRCTVIKVHGDYLDTRLKNTPDEVGKYAPEMDRFIDQVFDEYGLIVSGWSAEWDKALRAAIERCPNRRYTTYWSAFGDTAADAQQLCDKRRAQIIKGMGADDFFSKLYEKVTSLKDLDGSHPLTPRIAVATLKRYMANDADRIRLHDLMMEETGKVSTALLTDVRRQTLSLKQYEAHLEILIPLVVAAGYWGKPMHRRLWLRCFQQLATHRSASPILMLPGEHYPAYLCFYAFGIGSLAGGQMSSLAYMLARSKAKTEQNEDDMLLHRLVMMLRDGGLDTTVKKEHQEYRNKKLPTSHYIQDLLRDPLKDYVPEEARYKELFAQFEYLSGLVLSDYYDKRLNQGPGAVVGTHMFYGKMPEHFQGEIDRQKNRWPFLKFGLFDGSLERLSAAKSSYDEAFHKVAVQVRFS